ncbi:hypothetical protein QVD17_31376 [Tagetes erecta]|uniref:Uncharacterized protein n=1 Tax=Tagetes erecta TaxID=13708 RepID=A0AAD8NP95_TARER|nr:hypothetical protein QVD17_31376 [Tagetes erecta]
MKADLHGYRVVKTVFYADVQLLASRISFWLLRVPTFVFHICPTGLREREIKTFTPKASMKVKNVRVLILMEFGKFGKKD